MPINLPKMPKIPSGLARKGIIPAVFIAALSSPLAINNLEQWEGNITQVYADHLANGLPTYCAGRTDKTAKVGTRLTSDQCKEVNKITLIEYGYSILECTDWDDLTERRLIGLTIFAINVGKSGACGSQAIRNINAGRYAQGCNLIAYTPGGTPNWSFANGVFIDGLHNRRKAERALCLNERPI